jgi:hypothetical protein
MSTLTGQQIKDTYDGLLKLADSTTGITSTYQQIQDGLGNDTNTRISTQGIISPNVVGMNNNTLKADFYGIGFQAGAGGANIANTQNRTLYSIFYDTGNFSYSAVSYNLGTLSSTSDVVTAAFYTTQFVPNVGIAPKDLVMSGITLESVAPSLTGLKTTILPSTLSFSGTGGGYYIVAYYVSNGGVTPTVRYGSGVFIVNNQSYAANLGMTLNAAGTGTQIGTRYAALSNASVINLPFQSSYTSNDISTNIITTITTQPTWGIALRPI